MLLIFNIDSSLPIGWQLPLSPPPPTWTLHLSPNQAELSSRRRWACLPVWRTATDSCESSYTRCSCNAEKSRGFLQIQHFLSWKAKVFQTSHSFLEWCNLTLVFKVHFWFVHISTIFLFSLSIVTAKIYGDFSFPMGRFALLKHWISIMSGYLIRCWFGWLSGICSDSGILYWPVQYPT